MSKYAPLAQFLAQRNSDVVRVSFSEIENFLGFELPGSKRTRAWWSNNPLNSVMTKVWLDAGWRTREVDMEGERVTFFQPNGKRVNDQSAQSAGQPADNLALDSLDPVARKVLDVLARRSGRSPADEALAVLNETLVP